MIGTFIALVSAKRIDSKIDDRQSYLALEKEDILKKQLACFLYRSEIAHNADIGCVANIVKVSRRFNEDHGITGILIFDGQRFVQYLEGPQQEVTELARKISLDIRHIHFTPQHQTQGITHRLFTDWTMAYISTDDAEPLAEMWMLNGEAAILCLRQLLPQLDAA